MKILKRLFGKNPSTVYGKGGMVVDFNANGFAEVDEATAQFFAGIPGYEVVGAVQGQLEKPPVTVKEPEQQEPEQQEPEQQDPEQQEPEQQEPEQQEPEQQEPEQQEAFDFETFKALNWQKQRSAVTAGEVPQEYLSLIIDGTFTDSVKSSARKMLEGDE